MPSAANGKTEKVASPEAAETPIRQIMTIIEHKIRNLEKRKSKLTSYRDLQKSGKDLNADQKIAVAKYDEVAQTLEFARDLWKQVTSIAVSADRDAKKQAKKEAWVRNATETNKIREVLLIMDCLMQMGIPEVRTDFLNGTNGAAKLSEDDLKLLDDLYPEVTPKHELNEEGVSNFHNHTSKAAEHLYSIIDGKPKEVLGSTYAHIKEVVVTIQECGYFEKQPDTPDTEPAPELEPEPEPEDAGAEAPLMFVPVPPAPQVVPAPAYPLRPLPPITLQEVEHAYFAQQYPQQRPISEVIGSQNFFFLQESEIDSPVGTPQPPPILNQPSPPAPIPTQTFTNQHYVQIQPARLPPEPAALPHFAPPDRAFLPPLAPPVVPLAAAAPPSAPPAQPAPPPAAAPAPAAAPGPGTGPAAERAATPPADDDWKEGDGPEAEEGEKPRAQPQGHGDGQGRYRRYGRNGRGPANGYRGRGGYNRQGSDGYNRQNNDGYNRQNNDGYNRQNNDGYNRQNNDGYNRQNNDGYNRQNSDGYSRQNNDSYQSRHGDYQNRQKDGYQSRPYNNDGYQSRHKEYQNRNNDNYYGNGDNGNGHQQNENARDSRDRYENGQSYQGGFKSRGRGPRGAPRGGSRGSRPPHFSRKTDNTVAE